MTKKVERQNRGPTEGRRKSKGGGGAGRGFSGEKGPSGQEHLAEISMNFGGEEERGTDRILEDSEN